MIIFPKWSPDIIDQLYQDGLFVNPSKAVEVLINKYVIRYSLT